ncbi:MAG: hypothetical protein ABIH59_02230 [archaeon]
MKINILTGMMLKELWQGWNFLQFKMKKITLIMFLAVFLLGFVSASLGEKCFSNADCESSYLTPEGIFYGYCDKKCVVADGLDGRLDSSSFEETLESKSITGNIASSPTGEIGEYYYSSQGDFWASYDYRHNLIGVYQGGEQLRETLYDLSGKPYAAWTRESGWVNSAIDPVGNIMKSEDANSNKLVNFYDEFGRLERSRFFNSKGEEDFWIDYCYDSFCNTRESCYREGSSSFNLVCEVKYKNGKNYFYYDILGRVVERTVVVYDSLQGSHAYTFLYEYNDDRSIKSVNYPDGKDLEYDYNSMGQLLSIDYGSESIADFSYEAFGGVNEKVLDPSGDKIYANYDYDEKNQLNSLFYSRGSPYNMNQELFSRGMTYDYVGNVKGISYSVDSGAPGVFQGADDSFVYDNLYRLTNAIYPGQTFGFTYKDLLGDRATKTIGAQTTTYNYEDGRLMSMASPEQEIFEYDENGNLILWKDLSLGKTSIYIYDSLNRMLLSDVMGSVSLYTYDDSNHRVVKKSSAGTTFYVYDAGNVVLEESFDYGECAYGCGDLNGDNIIDTHDFNALLNVVFFSLVEPPTLCAADLDESGTIDYNDLPILANAVYGEGALSCSGQGTLSDDLRLGKTINDVEFYLKSTFAT